MNEPKYVQDKRGNEVEVITRSFSRYYPNPFPRRAVNQNLSAGIVSNLAHSTRTEEATDGS